MNTKMNDPVSGEDRPIEDTVTKTVGVLLGVAVAGLLAIATVENPDDSQQLAVLAFSVQIPVLASLWICSTVPQFRKHFSKTTWKAGIAVCVVMGAGLADLLGFGFLVAHFEGPYLRYYYWSCGAALLLGFVLLIGFKE
jgi:hypothetical protein